MFGVADLWSRWPLAAIVGLSVHPALKRLAEGQSLLVWALEEI